MHCNRSNSFLYVNGVKIYQFKALDSMDMYDFSVDYNTYGVSGIVGIHKYLMTKNKTK